MSEPLVPGLRTSHGVAVPLQAVSIAGEVLAGHGVLRVSQTYRNTEAEPIEALYTFPLPAEGAVTAFRYSCGATLLEGEIRKRDEALREYTEAVHSGHGAALLELERNDVFSASVGNVLPNEEVRIEVEVMTRLEFVDGLLRLKIPTLVAPRYIAGEPSGQRSAFGWADPTDLVPDADRITPRIGDVNYGASLELRVALGFDVEISSPSHQLEVLPAPQGGRMVRFAAGRVALDRDLVLRLSAPRVESSSGLIANRVNGGTGTFALTLIPDLAGASAGRHHLDVVFVLDRSGSMDGDSIREARAAVSACLRQLRTGDRFALLAFNTTLERFRQGLCPFDESSLDSAERWVQGIDARGGTKIGPALQEALSLAPDGTVVLLTDAQVGDEDGVLQRLVASKSSARVFSFGIGTNVASGLLEALAKRSGGAVEEIHPGEPIAEKVLAQFARAVSLRVERLQVSTDGLKIDGLVPAQPVALTDGEPFVLLGRYPRAGRGTLQIRGKLEGRPWQLQKKLVLPTSGVAPALERVWAKRRIVELERLATGIDNPRRRQQVEKESLAISLEFRVLSRETAFIVVDRRSGERLRPGSPAVRMVPVEQPAGWRKSILMCNQIHAACCYEGFDLSAKYAIDDDHHIPTILLAQMDADTSTRPGESRTPEMREQAARNDFEYSSRQSDDLFDDASEDQIDGPALRVRSTVHTLARLVKETPGVHWGSIAPAETLVALLDDLEVAAELDDAWRRVALKIAFLLAPTVEIKDRARARWIEMFHESLDDIHPDEFEEDLRRLESFDSPGPGHFQDDDIPF